MTLAVVLAAAILAFALAAAAQEPAVRIPGEGFAAAVAGERGAGFHPGKKLPAGPLFHPSEK